MNCPCENCVVFAMCLSKPIIDLLSCKLMLEYLHIEDIYQKHSRLTFVKTLFKKHNMSVKLVLSLIQDIETFMDYQRKRNSHL